MNTVENIGDHLAYTCQCGGVNFCLLRSGNVECNKCQDRPGMTWTYEEKDESSQCKECFGKGWNEVFHKVAGHYEGGEVFQDECEACGGSGAAAPAPVAQPADPMALLTDADVLASADGWRQFDAPEGVNFATRMVYGACRAAMNAYRDALVRAAPAPVLTRELVREVTADAQEVFQAGSSDTLQVVRDVIEYFSASLKARIDRAEATGHGASKT